MAPMQTELFTGLPGGEAARPRRRAPIFTISRMTIPVPLEQGMLGLVAALLCVVVTYALGVERGRHLSRGGEIPSPAPAQRSASLATPPIQEQAAPSAAAPFMIQLATFSTPTLAQRDLNRLAGQGQHPFLLASGKYSLLCVGRYATKAEATKHLAAFRHGYRDCFVRQR